jgi:hypothetical protein
MWYSLSDETESVAECEEQGMYIDHGEHCHKHDSSIRDNQESHSIVTTSSFEGAKLNRTTNINRFQRTLLEAQLFN